MEISKELLSEVLGSIKMEDITREPSKLDFRTINYQYLGQECHINIHELAHKCKEWANSLGARIISGFDEDVYNEGLKEYTAIVNHIYCEGGCRSDYITTSDTEPEAIFKACEWILNNKG